MPLIRSPAAQRRVLRDIASCRTAALGGHVEVCARCGAQKISYNSCRNRHCPKCQSLAKARWLEQRKAELLPVQYFHVVFTVPQQVAELALANPRLVYDILFSAAAETLRTIAADPKHLGAEIGFLAVLHTWGQNLLHHPHVHCVVPGGGLAARQQHWISCRPGFFLPVKVLSRLFRRLFLEQLRQAYDDGRLQLHGPLEELQSPSAFAALLDRLSESEWVVFAKRPFAGPQQVLEYLARYTHRVALSNDRILQIVDERVTFVWKDYRHGGRRRRMSLDAERVSPPLPLARPAARLRAAAALRDARQPTPSATTGSSARAPRLSDRTAGRRTSRLEGARREAHGHRSDPLSCLSPRHTGHFCRGPRLPARQAHRTARFLLTNTAHDRDLQLRSPHAMLHRLARVTVCLDWQRQRLTSLVEPVLSRLPSPNRPIHGRQLSPVHLPRDLDTTAQHRSTRFRPHSCTGRGFVQPALSEVLQAPG